MAEQATKSHAGHKTAHNESSPHEVVEILDTTLRDGAQGEGISFSVSDKLAVVKALDELGVTWIEAGNPGSNPKDLEFFKAAKDLTLGTARLCAFGATRKKDVSPADDPNVASLLEAGTEAVVLFGKSWKLHVTEVLKASLEENLAMIGESVAFFKAAGKIVHYDAEHFFDGYSADPGYALLTLKAALDAGADSIVLCDTNGGSCPDFIRKAVLEAKEYCGREGAGRGPVTIGIHAHDDSGMGVANSIAAVQAGARHVQGTLIGFGERCGNAALAAIIPTLSLKLGYTTVQPERLQSLTEISRRIAEIANVQIPPGMPYIGSRAFAHKAGMHIDGILKVRASFEHIDPELVGNDRRFLMSEIGGRSSIVEKARRVDPTIAKDHPASYAISKKVKELEAEGWQFEGADASFELLVRRVLGKYKPFFAIERYRVISEHPVMEKDTCSYAYINVLVDGKHEIAAAEGNGPVNALDAAMRRALGKFYPELATVRLSDYKVRVINGSDATAAFVRVLIDSTDGKETWTTVGVSTDIIDASRSALVDSIEYRLIHDIERRFKPYL
jgi:2-isopropylmalate synthase